EHEAVDRIERRDGVERRLQAPAPCTGGEVTNGAVADERLVVWSEKPLEQFAVSGGALTRGVGEADRASHYGHEKRRQHASRHWSRHLSSIAGAEGRID